MKDIGNIKKKVLKIYEKSKIYLRSDEIENLEITDLGLGDFYNIGLGLIIYINTERVCAKEMVLLPKQICPQHRHPPVSNTQGKEETFRCRWGEVYLYVSGPGSIDRIKAKIPGRYIGKFNVFHEIILKPGDQYTLNPNTWHWFQGGPKEAGITVD
ncbi:MAG: D-lyxose/D-mannose family sugar isomerase, partial [Actinobacteria bacterium]|nr:D-lyxose/D-mannose family sugar isomerase [Actinomycetota bacterium]